MVSKTMKSIEMTKVTIEASKAKKSQMKDKMKEDN
jgi:hypothetical protein